MTFFFEKTKHPKIFKDTYWGGFSVENAAYDTSEFIKNRDDFVLKNKVKALKTCPSLQSHNKQTKLFDHCELYQQETGQLILVNSPYGEVTEELATIGFEETAPLYHPHAKTFVKHFETLADVKKFANSK
jgi:hypothetical protein